MYTRCPICKTNFSVAEAQLQVAQGKVRCGSCKNVFNARQHIYYRSAKSTTPETPSAPKTEPTQPISETDSEPLASSKISKPSSIDEIFNALDSQLTSGTYIDIAQPVNTDIRETDFDDDDNDNLDEASSYQQPFIENTDEPDLDLSWVSNADDNKEASDASTDDTGLLNAFDNIKANKPQTKTAKQTPPEKDGPQHTFDFVSLTDEPALSAEDEKQYSAVNKPLDTNADPKLKKQTQNAALHEAIDNIIKVDSKITTPFEEQDDDHFVIEMHSQPDVELVDEGDIDKLFASTDSLKISDLKFDKHPINHQIEEPISDLSQNSAQNIAQPEIDIDAKETELQFEYEQNNETPFNQQVEEQLKPENFDHDQLSDDEFNEADFDSDSVALEIDSDNFDIEEEMVLTNPDENETSIPHRLRDAVASFDQQQPPLSMAKRLVYSLASLVLIVLLATQLVLFKSTALANSFPTLQPMLLSLCNNLPCRYTGNHNSKQIKIVSRDVRLHPKIKGALLINATIINQAGYTQPYPTILLKFTDLTGNTVAQRYFPPKDYLGLLNKPFALMPGKKPVQLNIEILDPGSDAINFQFFFL